MATDRTAVLVVPAAAMLLLWPALWNGFPIVFADTGTYLSQAIHHVGGWDRPVFYSLFMLPLHLTVTLWPVVVAQALLATWVLWLLVRILVPDVSRIAFVAGVGILSICTWLPWLVCELMPDVFTPLLVLVLCLLGVVPERLSRWERAALAGFAAFMVASQLSSLPLTGVLVVVLLAFVRLVDPPRRWALVVPPPAFGPVSRPDRDLRSLIPGGRHSPIMPRRDGPGQGMARQIPSRSGRGKRFRPSCSAWFRRWLLIVLPLVVAVLGLCIVNLAAYGRFAVSPFGNVFLLARVIYDGPGMSVLRRDCPTANWRLCPFLDSFPPDSDDFLWTAPSPLRRAGGAKLVSRDAGAIVTAAVLADPIGEAGAMLANSLEQLTRFASGDGLNAWPEQVTPWIKADFPAREQAAYASARQQVGSLSVPALLSWLHAITALGGVVGCMILLPVAVRRRAVCGGFLLTVLVALPVSAAITGGLSAPHDRYQARIMWLPPLIAVVSLASLRRRPVSGGEYAA